MKNRVQLTAYANRFGGSVGTLAKLLRTRFQGVYEGVRLLPDDASGTNASDADWAGIKDLSRTHEVMADIPTAVMDSLIGPDRKDKNSEAWDRVLAILDQQSAAGVTDVCFDATGLMAKETAGETAADAHGGADAAHGMVLGASDLIARLTEEAHKRGMTVVARAHAYYRQQAEIARLTDKAYDFALSALLLRALTIGDAAPLAKWITVRPTNAISVLDTRNGIGLSDVSADRHDRGRAGLMSDAEIRQLVRSICANTHGESATAAAATDPAASASAPVDADPSQINSTYYSALGCDDVKYLAARAVQFFLPGVPQVYYMGAMMAANDTDLLKQTGTGRDINRHFYSDKEIVANLLRPEVRAFNALCRFRNSLEAFSGSFSYGYDDTYGVLSILWNGKTTSARLDFDPRIIADRSELGRAAADAGEDISWRSVATITWTDGTGEHKTNNLLNHPPVVGQKDAD